MIGALALGQACTTQSQLRVHFYPWEMLTLLRVTLSLTVSLIHKLCACIRTRLHAHNMFTCWDSACLTSYVKHILVMLLCVISCSVLRPANICSSGFC